MHEVLLERAAERDLKALSRAVYDRIISHLKTLSQNPRPGGCKKITGSRNDWRIRIGDYRVIYEIDDRAKVVKVMRIRHRREAYVDKFGTLRQVTAPFDVSRILETWKFRQERERTRLVRHERTSDQLLRSGTSVGAHFREAQRAKSNPDFISKLEGGMQELEETAYWLEMLEGAKFCGRDQLEPLNNEAELLLRGINP